MIARFWLWLSKIHASFREESTVLLRHPKRPLTTLIPLIVFWGSMNLYNYLDTGKQSSCSLRSVDRSNWFESHAYDWLMSWRYHGGLTGPAAPEEKVAYVTISANSEPLTVLTNTCDARRLVAALVNRLSKLNPSVIAIDLSYSNGSCSDSEMSRADKTRTVNQDLVDAFRNASAAIVVGQATQQRADVKTAADAKGVDDCLVLLDGFPFGDRGAGRVQAGLTRLNSNASKIPLRWWVFHDEDSLKAKKTEPYSGFAFQAAQAAIDGDNQGMQAGQVRRVDLAGDPNLKQYLDQDEHPYTSFKNSLPHWTAMDVLCYAPKGQEQRLIDLKCGENVAHTPIDRMLKGKVVVIGEQIESEEKEVEGGVRYGLDLQANYIDALLETRYVRERLHTVPLLGWFMPEDYLWIGLFVLLMIVFDGMVSRRRIRDWQAFATLWGILLVMMVAAGLLLRFHGIFYRYLFLSFLPFSFNLIGKVPFMFSTRIQKKVERKTVPAKKDVL